MSKRNRRKHSSSFKAKVALAALKEREIITVLSQRFELHATQINNWKARAIEIIESGFDEKATKSTKDEHEAFVTELYC